MEHRIAIIGLGYVGLPWLSNSGKNTPPWVSTSTKQNLRARESSRQDPGNEPGGTQVATMLTYTTTRRPQSLQHLHRHRPHTGRCIQPAGPHPAAQGQRNRGKAHQEGRHRHYESTVYPGATEEDCVPVIEKTRTEIQRRFLLRLLPRAHQPRRQGTPLTNISKVTSGSTPEVAEIVDALYGSIITAGTHKRPAIKVAEAAKVIENTQRDINIAFVNELAMIFDRMGIDTERRAGGRRHQVELPALPPGPGRRPLHRRRPLLPDPQGREPGLPPQVILAGRRINDGMGSYVARPASSR